MKVRNGFVSNSSSASFVLKIETTLPDEEIEKIIHLRDSYLQNVWDKPYEFLDINNSNFEEGEIHYSPMDDIQAREKIIKKDGKFIYITLDTDMFNDWTDVPGWKFIRLISENKHPKIRLLEIRKIYSEYNDCNIHVDYDPYIWNSDEDKAAQFRVDKEYIQYLMDIGIEITNKELKKLLL
jgi:hypothetical protein